MATQARKYPFHLIDFSSTSHTSRLFLIKFLNSVALFGSTAASFVPPSRPQTHQGFALVWDHFRFLCPNGTCLRNIPLEERGGPPEAEDEGADPFSLLGGLNQRVELSRLASRSAPHQVGICI